MKLLLAFAFLAVASAVTLPQPIQLRAPALPLFQKTEDIPSADASVEAVEDAVVQPVIVVDSADAPEAFDAEVDAVRVVDLPVFDDEYAPATLPLFSMPDIRPLIVPEEVMRQVAAMAAQEAEPLEIEPVKVVDSPVNDASQFEYASAEALEIEPVKVVDSPVNDASQFEYASAEALEIEPVKVVDSPINDASQFEDASAEALEIEPVKVVDSPINDASQFEDASAEALEIEPVKVVDSPINDASQFEYANAEPQVDPVIVVDEAVNEQTAPLESLDAPETVKVVDAPSEFPQEYLRNPQQDIPMENFYPGHLAGANNPLLRVECPIHF